MKISLQGTVKNFSEGVKAEIEQPRDDLHIAEVYEELVYPVLIAYGFSPEVVYRGAKDTAEEKLLKDLTAG